MGPVAQIGYSEQFLKIESFFVFEAYNTCGRIFSQKNRISQINHMLWTKL